VTRRDSVTVNDPAGDALSGPHWPEIVEYFCCLRLVPRAVDNLLVLWRFEHGLKVNRLVDGTGERYELCHTLDDELISVGYLYSLVLFYFTEKLLKKVIFMSVCLKFVRICHVRHTLALMCAKNHLLIFSSFLDIWENVEWPRFFGAPGGSSRRGSTDLVDCRAAQGPYA